MKPLYKKPKKPGKGESGHERRLFQKGEPVFRQGDLSTCAYIINSGRIGIFRESPSGGKSVLLKILEEEEIFGEMGLIDSKPRSASAIALEESILTVIKSDRFEYLADHHDAFFGTLLKSLTHRLRETLKRVNAQKALPRKSKKRSPFNPFNS